MTGNVVANGGIGSDGALHGEGRVGVHSEKSLTTASVAERRVTQHDWRRLGPATLQVGPTGKMLEGALITDFAGWRVKPASTSEASGVIARIKVRENWINFDDVEVRRTPANFVQIVKDLWSPEKHQRRKYFELLLRHLAQTELRDHQEGGLATIAADAIVVRPLEERVVSINAGESRREIDIDRERLERFLQTEEGHEAGALIALGLQRDIIRSAEENQVEKPKPKRGTVFVPESAPPHAAALFKQIYDRKSLPMSELVHPTSLKDLKTLGLVTRDRDGMVKLKDDRGSLRINPDAILRRAVSEMPCIKLASAVLLINPDVSPTDVADAVALELGRDWPTHGTKLRNGNAIIRWTVWLEPHLLDTSRSSIAAARVTYATEPNVVKGRPGLRKAAEPELRRLLAAGTSVAEVAKRLKVSVQTIYLWKQQLGL